jgi:hypothetical protein
MIHISGILDLQRAQELPKHNGPFIRTGNSPGELEQIPVTLRNIK